MILSTHTVVRRSGLTRRQRSSTTITMIVRVTALWLRRLRAVHISNTLSPVTWWRSSLKRWRWWALMVRRSKLTWSRSAPLSRRTIWCCSRRLVVVWLDILRSWWCTICLSCATLTTAEEIQTRLDVCICGIKLCCTLVGVKSVAGLVVAGLILFQICQTRLLSVGKITFAYQGTKVIPDF